MPLFGDPLWIVVAALALDALVGDPDFIWRRIPHPVAAFGAAIGGLDRALNRPDWPFAGRRLAGVAAVAVLVVGAAAVGLLLAGLARRMPASNAVLALLGAVFVAQRSLYEHVEQVRVALARVGVEAGRAAVSRIVGRNPEDLQQDGVCRAAIESCAESFCDGVVAPVFWFALLGLPGLLAYKAVNTADSIVGHRDEQYASFGWAAARLDDVLNFSPARLSAILIACTASAAGGSTATALRVMWRDAGLHRSPNAGWPESAMAGALGIALGGPRRYGREFVVEPLFNQNCTAAATPGDIGRALRLLVAACVLHAAIYAALTLAL